MTEKSAATAVIVLAAGAGTRMKSKTPKILHTIGGRSLVGHVLHGAAAASPDRLVAVVGHERERVTAAVNEIAAEIGISQMHVSRLLAKALEALRASLSETDN